MNKRYLLGLLLSAFGGYLALSYELIWMRAFSVAVSNRAPSFPMLLGVFLAGIAYGAKISKRYTEKSETYDSAGLRHIGIWLGAASICGFLTAPAMGWYLRIAYKMPHFTALYLVFGASVVLGVLFPLISHFGIPADERSGSRLSYFYGANIVGSVAGSLFTGFVLFDVLSLAHLSTGLSVLGLIIAGAVLFVAEPEKRVRNTALSAIAVVVLAASQSFVFTKFWENLVFQNEAPSQTFVRVLETSDNVIFMNQDDEVFSGSVYDGQFNVGLEDDTNGVVRAYAVSAFHESPKNVLMIGLASGSWARAIVNSEDVEKLTVVEISDSYIELIETTPEWKSLLTHPKIEIIIDDGRRWLRNNEVKFDYVVSNTTFHWVSMATTVLSVEFFKLVAENMTEDGVFIYNTTGSEESFAAIFEAFPHGARYMRIGVASHAPIKPDAKRFREALLRWKIDGEPVINMETEAGRKALEDAVLSLEEQFEAEPFLRKRMEGVTPYTDDNLGGEFQGLVGF